MAITKPGGASSPYVEPSSMNQPSRPRPTAGAVPAPQGASPLAPTPWEYTIVDSSSQRHAAFDQLDGGGSTLADGCYESTLD
jgi:hypothetical protein